MKKLTPMRAIRKKCLECSGGISYEVKNCLIEKCPLWAYRSGHRPKTDILSTEEGETTKPPRRDGVNDKTENPTDGNQ